VCLEQGVASELRRLWHCQNADRFLPFAKPPLCGPVSPAGFDFFVFDPALRKFPFVLVEVANLDQRRPDLQ